VHHGNHFLDREKKEVKTAGLSPLVYLGEGGRKEGEQGEKRALREKRLTAAMRRKKGSRDYLYFQLLSVLKRRKGKSSRHPSRR